MAIKEELEKKIEEEKTAEGLLDGLDITEDIIWAGVQKIKTIYDRVDENDEVALLSLVFGCLSEYLQLLVSVMRRDRLYPTLPGVNVDVFVKVWI